MARKPLELYTYVSMYVDVMLFRECSCIIYSGEELASFKFF